MAQRSSPSAAPSCAARHEERSRQASVLRRRGQLLAVLGTTLLLLRTRSATDADAVFCPGRARRPDGIGRRSAAGVPGALPLESRGRQVLRSGAASRAARGGDGAGEVGTVDWRTPKPTLPEQRWDLWPALPIAPYERRRTLLRELVPGQLWSFEQKQGIYYVHVPIRMTVYRMQTRRGLLVYAPVAPTEECVALLRELEALHGEVAYIVLPTLAVEHKYFVGAFARQFFKAEVWVCPGQFSVPPAPLELLGFPGERIRFLPADPRDASVPEDWRQEGIDFRVLGPIGKDLPIGFAEVVFYLRPLRTMLVTDLVLSVPTAIPDIIAEDPRGLVFHARDGPTTLPDTSPEALARGWRRICIFALMFGTTAIDTQNVIEATRDAFSSPAKEMGWSGYLPCNYRERWEDTFNALRGTDGGGLLVPPILSELVLNRYLTSDVWPFVQDVASSWSDMACVVPAHFDAPVQAGARDWQGAFERAFGEPPAQPSAFQLPSFFRGGPAPGPQPLEADLEFIRSISKIFTFIGAVDPPERLTYQAGLDQEAETAGRA